MSSKLVSLARHWALGSFGIYCMGCTPPARPPALPADLSGDQIRLSLGAKDIPPSDVNVGADYREKSVRLSDRLARVTTYSDQAELVRVGETELTSGVHWLEIGDLRAGYVPSSVRFELQKGFQGRILQVVGEEVFAKGLLSRESRLKMEKLRSAYAELVALEQRERASEGQLQFVRNLKMDAPFQKTAPQTNYKGFSANPETLKSAIGEIQDRAGTLLHKVEALRADEAELRLKIQKLEGELHLAESGGPGEEQDWKTRFFLLVDSKTRQAARLELRYRMPNALWRPVYDIRAELDRTSGTATLQLLTAGMIEQKTGEDWKGVRLTLSTVDPAPLFLPKLDRWILRESRTEAEPLAQNVAGGASFRLFNALQDKESAPGNVAANRPEAAKRKAESVRDEKRRSLPKDAPLREAEEDYAAPKGAGPAAPAMESSLASSEALDEMVASPAASGAVGRVDGASELKRREQSRVLPMNTLEQLFPELARLKQASESGSPPERVRPLDPAWMQASTGREAEERHLDSRLPAAQAEGRRIEFSSPFAVDVASGGLPLKIAVHRQQIKAKLSYFAVPKVDARVFLRAETVNSSDLPLLAGPAQIYMDGDLVSKTDLSTVSEGGHFVVDLGVDKNIETKRIVDKKSKDSSFLGLGKKHATSVDVRIELANHHPFDVRMDLQDHFPLAPNDDVKTTLTFVSPDVPAANRKDGMLRWTVLVPAKSKQVVKFSYDVIHPDNLLVSEFN